MIIRFQKLSEEHATILERRKKIEEEELRKKTLERQKLIERCKKQAEYPPFIHAIMKKRLRQLF